MVAGAKVADQPGLETSGGELEHVHVVAALGAHQRGEQADRPSSGHEHAIPARAGAGADPLDVIPGLGEHARRLGEHAQVAELGRNGDRELGLEGHQLRAVAVTALDAALGVEPVAAHVPFTAGAAVAGHRIGPPHDRRHRRPGLEAAVLGSADHPGEQLVAEHQPLVALRRRSVGAGQDLPIGAAHAQHQRLDQQLARPRLGIGQLGQRGAPLPAGYQGDRAQAASIPLV